MKRIEKKGLYRNLKIMFVMLIAVMMLGSSLRTEAAAGYTTARTDKSKTFVGKGTCIAEIYFDRIVLKGNSAAVKKINRQIKKESSRFLREALDSSLFSYAEAYADSYAEKMTMYYSADSQVTYNKKNIISILIETSWFAGGVNNTERYGMTFSLKNGKLLKLTDVCKGSDSSIKKRIVKKAKKEADITNNPHGISTIQNYKTKNFKYYLNKKGKAVVCFGPYEVSYGGWYREFVISSKYNK